MPNYGLPYMGSKNSIADDIINFLPRGNRFVDLFGGGGAVSHCALLSGKYNKVYYNELNSLCSDLLKRAINCEFNNFKPKFITRDEFNKKKDEDGYIKYVWSFGNNGKNYLFGRDKEEFKRQAHNFVVFNDKEGLDFLENHFKESYYWHIKNMYDDNRLLSRKNYTNGILKIEAIRVTMLYDDAIYNDFKNLSYTMFKELPLKSIVKSINEHLPNIPKKYYKSDNKKLDSLKSLQQLQQLERLDKFIINNGSYEDYVYNEGDIVYCDPPYENTASYTPDGFNHQKFYDWVYSRPYQVFFSSYDISDKRFFTVFEKEKRGTFNVKNSSNRLEKIYSNQKTVKEKSPFEAFGW